MAIESNKVTYDNSVEDDDLYLANITANENSHMYDWLADTGSTNHIVNSCELFVTYESTPDATICGVGSKNTQVLGRGTVKLIAQYGMRKHLLRLENVNYIPANKYNILTLGRWDTNGCRYQASDGTLTLYDHQNVPILNRSKFASHLYKFCLQPANEDKNINSNKFTFSSHEGLQSWETWHQRFGHVSYNSLKKLHSRNLLHGFTVDPKTPTPDCIPCTLAKQMCRPFDSRSEIACREKRELTHMDLWGKYDCTPTNGHQYYILLIDDTTH